MQGYDSLHAGVAWLDVGGRGRIRVTGEDRVRLIHAIASNSVETLRPGQGTYAFFLNAQGQIQSDSRIFVAEDHLLIDCEPDYRRKLTEHLESFIIMDDVALEDAAARTAMLRIGGPRAVEALSRLGSPPPGNLYGWVAGGEVSFFRVPPARRPSFLAMVRLGAKAEFLNDLRSAGAEEGSREAFETVRVEDGLPRFGVDFNERNIPHETQQLNALSFTKGCYTGQEIVERVRSLGRVNRLLVGIEIDAKQAPGDLTVRHEGAEVGTMTSAFYSPRREKVLGFAIVRRRAASAGTGVTVGGVRALISNVSRSG